MKRAPAIAVGLLIVTGIACVIWHGRKTDAPGKISSRSTEIHEGVTARPAFEEKVQPARNEEVSRPALAVSPKPEATPERSRIYASQIEAIFGDVLEILHLQPPQLATVKHLLLERWEVGIDVQEIVSATPNTSVRDRLALGDAARAKIDEELEAAVGESAFLQIKRMVADTTQLNTIRIRLDPRFAEAGVPLTPEQKFILAEVWREVYEPGDKTRDALKLRTQDIDPATGLAALDRIVIEKMSGVFSPTQLAVLSAQHAENTARILKSMAEDDH